MIELSTADKEGDYEMRPHYADYVKHAMRFYAKNRMNASSEQPRFRSEADRKNWEACKSAISTFDAENQDILLSLYVEDDNIVECINRAAKRERISADRIWNLVNELEKKVAKRRGLI